MYTFGKEANRKQTQQTAYGEYLLLSSEPIIEVSNDNLPQYTYTNRYLAKRHVMRTIRRMRQQNI